MPGDTACLVLPDYMARLSAEELVFEKQRFLVRLAAVYASDAGTVTELNRILGKGVHYLHKFTRYTPTPELFTAEVAVAIEKASGGKVVRREELCPHIFK